MQQQPETVRVIIVGAGPLGIELAISLEQMGVDYLLLEANQIGDAFTKWPPHTRFFSTPEHVAIAGFPVQTVTQQPITGEEYLAYLRMLVEHFNLKLHVYEPVTHLAQENGRFQVTTQRRTGPYRYDAEYVVLAIGGMAAPRRLNIPGEDLPHVTHYFPDPHTYFRTRLLVVGGRNSAVEAALRSWRVGAAEVILSYRRPELNFDRVKPHLGMDLGDRLKKGEITFLGGTIPVEITPTHVVLASTDDGVTPNGRLIKQPADFVLLATGFVADNRLYEQMGVELHGEEQAPVYNPETMETNVPGLFVLGTAAGGSQSRKFKYFISTTHDHVGKITQAITGQIPDKLGTVDARNNAVSWQEVRLN